MTLQQIKYFLEVAHTLNFTAAAKRLYVAQSSMSYAIHELEQELGVPLFVRNANKRVTLTEYGEKYFPYAEQIFELLEKGDQEIKRMKDPLSGTVKIGFFYCIANKVMPWIFSRFHADNPNTDIFLDFAINQGDGRIDDLLLLGKYDLIISTHQYIKDCVCKKIGTQDAKLILSNNHHLADRSSIKPEDLDGEPIIGINPASNLDNFIRDMFSSCRIKPDISYAADWMTQYGYVALDYGIAIAPSMPLYSEYITEIDIDYPGMARDLFLVWPKNRKISKTAEFVRDYILKLTEAEPLC